MVGAFQPPINLSCRRNCRSCRKLRQKVQSGRDVAAVRHLLDGHGTARASAAADLPSLFGRPPVRLPYEKAVLWRGLDQRLERLGLRPQVRGKLMDSAVMKTFGAAGHALFPIPQVLERDVAR